mmetsp:Transcript_17528/g.61609  ORF Transcript_17528/g.61609 Transcript_17528/m.61609 type:complete len:247 (-) Transcript_17528:180-920(-)
MDQAVRAAALAELEDTGGWGAAAVKDGVTYYTRDGKPGFEETRGLKCSAELAPLGGDYLKAAKDKKKRRAALDAAAGEAAPLGVRVVQIRTGVVLGRDGGALAQMLTPFEFGLGGPMGSGKQVMPWIHIDDILRVVAEAINNPALAGAVNGTAPQPATNEELTGALAAVMRRPNLLRVPAFALKLLFGGQFAHELLLTGQRVVPRRLTDAGFQFAYPTLEGALREVVKGDTSGRAVDASASREKDE